MQNSALGLAAILMGLISFSAISAQEPERRQGRGEGEIRIESGRDRTPRANKAEGTVTAVNVTTGQVAIRMRNGVTFVVVATASTKIERNDRHVSLAAIRVGDRGESLYDNNFIASKIESTGP